ENTRLFNELRQRTDDLSESLERQTATSEVLRVISSSPGELEPVFQAMLENATRSARLSSEHSTSPKPMPFVRLPCTVPRQRLPKRGGEIQWSALTPKQRSDARWRRSGQFKSAMSRTSRVTPMPRQAQLERSLPSSQAHGQCLPSRWSKKTSWLAPLLSTADRSAPLPTSRSNLSRISPIRPSSPSRTPVCSTSCASRCSSRPPPPTCSR